MVVVFFGWVMIGVIRCGMFLYGVSFIIFGLIRIILIFFGVVWVNSDISMELMKLDFFEFVELVISRCGILVRLVEMKLFLMFLFSLIING